MNAGVAAGEDLGPKEPFVWCMRSRPACFFDRALCKPASSDDWRDPEVAALLEASHSLHYAAAFSERHLSCEIAGDLRERAHMLECATGVLLEKEGEAHFPAGFAG